VPGSTTEPCSRPPSLCSPELDPRSPTVRLSAAAIAHRGWFQDFPDPLNVFTGTPRVDPRRPEARGAPAAIFPTSAAYLRPYSAAAVVASTSAQPSSRPEPLGELPLRALVLLRRIS
jgi:hypothetical protein